MKSIRYYIDLLEGKMDRPHQGELEMSVENWREEESPDTLNLLIKYSIAGRDRPATSYEPAEQAELDSYEVYDADTGQLITDLPDYMNSELEKAIWKDLDQTKNNQYRDYDPPDSYYR